MIASLAAQLACFYEEQALAGGKTHGELMQTLESLEAQLKDVYEERERMGAESAPIVAEVDSTDPSLAVTSLEAQVRVLLEERDDEQAAADAGRVAVGSLEAQVRALLDEKAELEGTVGSLEEQVRALLDEKRELEAQLSGTRDRARRATHALIEQFVIEP
ncbi:MAG: hypothetical protein MUC96_19425 [Myxococcaceae bacterium]|jgi:chromosome segregation ATPase|nr:hypothetical protein [Myxococcaceae bacterium]